VPGQQVAGRAEVPSMRIAVITVQNDIMYIVGAAC
jgi:hypothetical protein